MSYFIKNGNSFRVADSASIDMHDHLPAGNYLVKMDLFENLYLEQIESFKPITKVYGDATRQADRIMSTFTDREVSTGVMLVGEKGSGKTLLAKNLSIKCAELGIPTIVINADWRGDKFNKLIQDIDQPCVILFDEFEKVYGRDEQQEILTLLDGVFPMKKLFVLTVNDKWGVDTHMRNRPGRIFYMLEFKGLATEFIVEYCNENLEYPEHTDGICKISSLFGEFNFDMLKAMVEEINRYGDTPMEAMEFLNIKPEGDSSGTYEIKLKIDGKIYKTEDSELNGNPLSRAEFNVWRDTVEDEDDCKTPSYFKVVTARDLHGVDRESGTLTFSQQVDGAAVTVSFTKKDNYKFNYSAL